MKIRKLLMFVVLLLAAALIFTGCGESSEKTKTPGSSVNDATKTPPQNEGKLKVGFVMTGRISDVGWNSAVNQAREGLEQQLDYVETMYIENIPDGGGDSERAMRQLIDQGAKVIVASSFGYGDSVKKLAQEFPKVYFLHSAGMATADNISTYQVRDYEGMYLTGMIAGKMTKTNIIGFVAANPIPQVFRCINGFAMGVKAVNPAAKVKVLWTSTWFDPAKEKEAALSLADAKADVLAQFQDSAAVQQAAQDKGIYGVGFHVDMQQFAPKANLASFAWNWAPLFAQEIEAFRAGNVRGRAIWSGIKEDTASVPINKDLVPVDVQQLVEEAMEKMADGQLSVFPGPIKNNKGQEVVKAGETLNDDQLLSTDWLLDNVIGNT